MTRSGDLLWLAPFWLALVGCGASAGAGAPPAAAGLPVHEEIVTDACEDCRDAACFRAARARFDAYVLEMGGIDELPASAHRSLERLETCTLAYADDVGTSIARAREQICGCEDRACVEAFVETWPTTLAELEASEAAERVDAEPALAQAQSCLAALSVSSIRYAEIAHRTAEATCRCTSLGCAEATMEARQTELDGAVYAEPGPETGASHEDDARTCRCFAAAAASTASTAIEGMIGIPVALRWSIDCDLD